MWFDSANTESEHTRKSCFLYIQPFGGLGEKRREGARKRSRFAVTSYKLVEEEFCTAFGVEARPNETHMSPRNILDAPMSLFCTTEQCRCSQISLAAENQYYASCRFLLSRS